MIKKLILPAIILLHIVVEWLYLIFACQNFGSNFTDALYWIADPLCISLIIFALIYAFLMKIIHHEIKLIIVYALFNSFRAYCYLLNSIGLMNRTFNLIMVTTLCVAFAGFIFNSRLLTRLIGKHDNY